MLCFSFAGEGQKKEEIWKEKGEISGNIVILPIQISFGANEAATVAPDMAQRAACTRQ